MAVSHKIRKDGKGNFKTIKLTARRAIIEHCKECLGWETNPKECSSCNCALYPFRSWETPVSTSGI